MSAQTPAFGFYHEAVHKFIELTYTDEQKKALKGMIVDPGTSNQLVDKEEFEIMEKFEYPASDAFKKAGITEGKRYAYSRGNAEYRSEGPTSTKETKTKNNYSDKGGK